MAKLTQKAILQTFDDMIHEMPFEKITVSALVKRCGISSNTFYYHYQDIYALLDKWLDVKLSEYPTEAYLTDAWKDVVKSLLHNMQDHPDVVKHVFNSITRERLERYVFEVLEVSVYQMVQKRAARLQLSPETEHMLGGAFCYSLCGFILKFVYDGMSADIDKVFDPIIAFLDTGFANYAAQESSTAADFGAEMP